MLPDSGLKATSYHNAGHAVATALMEFEEAHGTCGHPGHQKRWNAEYEAATALGGVIAERLFLGVIDPVGAKNDVENAFRHISSLTTIPGEQAAYISFLSAQIEYLLEKHRDFIQHVAFELEQSDRAANEIARADIEQFVGARR